MPADGVGLPADMRGEFGASPCRGQLQVSKVLDRASKLYGYRINAYVVLGIALTVCRLRPTPGGALATETPDVPQKVA
jgi:hypothetical protein